VGRDQLDAALSVTTVAAGQLDVGEGSELEIGEGLESLGSGGVAQAVGQPSKPLCILAEMGNGVMAIGPQLPRPSSTLPQETIILADRCRLAGANLTV